MQMIRSNKEKLNETLKGYEKSTKILQMCFTSNTTFIIVVVLYIDPGGEAGAARYPEEEGGSGRGRGEEVGQFFKIFVCTLAR